MAKTPSLTRKNPAGWATLHPPCTTLHYPALPCTLPPLQGGAGYLQGKVPCTYLADKDGQKPLLGGGVQGLQGGFARG